MTGSDPEAPEEPGRDEVPVPGAEAPWPERAIRTYFEEPTLWPVLAVAVLIFATFGAAIALLAIRERRIPAIAALLLLILLSARGLDADIRRRRLGPVGWLILSLWAASLGVAAGLAWLGVF